MPIFKFDDFAKIINNGNKIVPKLNDKVSIEVDRKYLYINQMQFPTGCAGDTGMSLMATYTGLYWGYPEAGSQGHTGSQGPTGAFGGPPGQTGVQGITGLIGPTGIQGFTGSQGITGLYTIREANSNPTGLINMDTYWDTSEEALYIKAENQWIQISAASQKGTTGAQGRTGLQGTTGFQGITGLQGRTGSQGFTGLQGRTGLIGSTGFQGPTGSQGLTGSQGQTGSRGLTGMRGITGIIGSTGIQGLTGSQGQTGSQGTTGLIGITGLRGLQGVTGISITGQTGLQGATGLRGETGTIDTTAWSTWSPTLVGWTGSPTVIAKYKQVGKVVNAFYLVSGFSNSTSTQMTLPVNCTYVLAQSVKVTDNDVAQTTPGNIIAATASNCVIYKDYASASWTNSGTKAIQGHLTYEST